MSDPSADPFVAFPEGFPSDHEFRGPLHRRRPLRRDTRRAHEHASATLRSIDTELEALVARRQACLVELDHHRTLLNRRYTTRHGGRRPMVDEPPVPPAPPHAAPLHGVDLRAVAITILRRHGPQRLRDLHGLLHCYGYVVDSDHPVQRLADAMAYECTRGRADRVSRGVYAAVTPHPGPARRRPILDAVALRQALYWVKPETDPAPPLIDPPVAHDPEHWTAGTWPGTEDPGIERPGTEAPNIEGPGTKAPETEDLETEGPDTADLRAEDHPDTQDLDPEAPDPADLMIEDPDTEEADPPPQRRPDSLGGDSPTNRSPGVRPGVPMAGPGGVGDADHGPMGDGSVDEGAADGGADPGSEPP